MKSCFSIKLLTILSGMLIPAFLIFGIFGCSDQNNTFLPGELNEFKVGESAASPDGQELQLAPPQNPFDWGWCTWYAAQKWLEWGYGLPSKRNAKFWLDDAQRNGYPTGQQPRFRAIMVLKGGGGVDDRGHVAIVEEVKWNQFRVSEMNWDGKFGKVTGRWTTVDRVKKNLAGFIYPKSR
jgi:surface antigen